jgi:uncharacterized protein (UPF0264 family)
MNIEIKKLNQILSNIGNFGSKYKSVAYENDGEYRPSTTNIYDVGDGLFLKETIKVDSYGNEPELTELQFVQPVSRTITDYETIK